MVEQLHGKEQVAGSIPANGSRLSLGRNRTERGSGRSAASPRVGSFRNREVLKAQAEGRAVSVLPNGSLIY